MFQKLLTISTDKLIAIHFVPCFLFAFAPFIPDTFNTIELFFLIPWIQLGMVFTLSYHTLISLNSKASDKLKASIQKFKFHSIINFLLCTMWLGIILFPMENLSVIETVPFLIKILFVSEIIRLKAIAKLLVSIELNRIAKFHDYFLTLLLILSLYGSWNIHKRIKAINKNNQTINQ